MGFSQEAKLLITMTLKDDASAGLKKVKGAADDAEKSTTRMAKAQEHLNSRMKLLGIGAVVGGVALLTAGLAEGVKGAIEEEASIAKLDAALKANVSGWDGNRGAIDKVIASRMKLAFTDDELRASLSILVTRSGNVEQAFKDQGLAMDYARFKSIDLGSASTIVSKALGGNMKALKELGIELRSGATEAEIFAAVQAKVGGQAEAFGKTTEGAMKGAQIAVSEAFETIGTKLLPVIKELANFITDKLVPGVLGIVDGLGEMKGAADKATESVKELQGAFALLSGPNGAGDTADSVSKDVTAMAKAAGMSTTEMAGYIKKVAYETGRQPIEVIHDFKDKWIEAWNQMATDGKAPAERAGTSVAADFNASFAAELKAGPANAAWAEAGAAVGQRYGEAGAEQIAKELADKKMHNLGLKRLAMVYEAGGTMLGGVAAGGIVKAFAKPLPPDAVRAGMQPLSAEAKRVARGIFDGIHHAFIGGGLAIPIDLSKGINANHGLVDQAMLRLKWAILHPINVAKERTYLNGILHGKALAKGLHSQDPAVRQQAQDTAALVRAALDRLTPAAASAGTRTGVAFKNNFITQLQQTVYQAQYKMAQLTHILGSTGGGIGRGGGGGTGDSGSAPRGSASTGGFSAPPRGSMGGNVVVHVTNNVSVRDIARSVSVRQRYGAPA